MSRAIFATAGVAIACVSSGSEELATAISGLPFARALGSTVTGTLLQFLGTAGEVQVIGTLFAPVNAELRLRLLENRLEVMSSHPTPTTLLSVLLDPTASLPCVAWMAEAETLLEA
jgi:hypothetical protein